MEVRHLKYLIEQNFGGQKFRRTKFFGGQNFRPYTDISAVLSAEIFNKYSIRQYFGGQIFQRTKFFGGQNFRQQGKFLAQIFLLFQCLAKDSFDPK